MSCTHSSSCPLFAQFAMEPALAVWKQHFCEGEFEKCARYQKSIKGEAVPLTLLPNGKMIERKQKSSEEMGGTALFNAILKKRAPMVKSMFNSNMASAQVRSADGSTPLMAAASVGSAEIIQILLDAGCNPFTRNANNLTALDVATQKNFPDCAKLLDDFMLSNPEKASESAQATAPAVSSGATDEKEEMSSVVSLLKKLNPFSR